MSPGAITDVVVDGSMSPSTSMLSTEVTPNPENSVGVWTSPQAGRSPWSTMLPPDSSENEGSQSVSSLLSTASRLAFSATSLPFSLWGYTKGKLWWGFDRMITRATPSTLRALT